MNTFSFFLILSVIVCFLLMLVIMVQNPKGGGLASSFGGSSQQLGGVQKTTNFLDKSTWFLAGILLVLILLTNSLINFPNASDQSSLLDNNIINEEITESFIDEVPENQENINNWWPCVMMSWKIF